MVPVLQLMPVCRLLLLFLFLCSTGCGDDDRGVVTVRVDAPVGATVTFTSPCSGEAVRGDAADLLRGSPVEILIENWGADGVASVFDHWEGGVPAILRYTNPLRITVETDLRLTAVNAAGWTTETAAPGFLVVGNTGTAPHEVGFDASDSCWAGGCPQDGKLWWSFGDEGTSKELAPLHRYDSPGIYTVTLRPLSEVGGPPPVTLSEVVVVHHPTKGSPFWYRCNEFHRGILDNLPEEEPLAHDVLDEINRIRVEGGLAPFTWDPLAAACARAEVADRIGRDWSGEPSPEGWSLDQRLSKMIGHTWEQVASTEAPGPGDPWGIAGHTYAAAIAGLGGGEAGVGVLTGDSGQVDYVVLIAHTGDKKELGSE